MKIMQLSLMAFGLLGVEATSIAVPLAHSAVERPAYANVSNDARGPADEVRDSALQAERRGTCSNLDLEISCNDTLDLHRSETDQVVLVLKDISQNPDGRSLELFCAPEGAIASCSVSPNALNIGGVNGSTVTEVTVTITANGVGGPGRAVVSVFDVTGQDLGDQLDAPIVVNVATRNLAVDLSFNNNDNMQAALCAASCFGVVQAYSTVPYFSLDQPRNVSLVYSSDGVEPRPFVYADVSMLWPENVQEYRMSLDVKWSGSYASQPFVNGDTVLRFSGGTSPRRLVGQIVARGGNGLTNVYPARLRVTAHLPNGVVDTIATDFDLMVLWRSEISAGWSLGGIQRLFPAAAGGVVITDGFGGATYFKACGSGCFTTPPGEFSSLKLEGDGAYTRSFPDSTKVRFNWFGGMASVTDRFGNRTDVEWDEYWGQPSHIRDPYRKDLTTFDIYDQLAYENATRAAIQLIYNDDGALSEIREPGPDGSATGGRVTMIEHTGPGSSRLAGIVSPAGDRHSFGYSSDGLMTWSAGLRNDTTHYAYDPVTRKLDSVIAPAIPLDAGGGAETSPVTPILQLRAWQSVGLPRVSTSAAPAAALPRDSMYAAITDAGGHRSTFTVDRWGQPVMMKDPLSNTTTVVRNGIFPERVFSPTGAVDTLRYEGPFLVYSRPAGGQPSFARYGAYGQVDSIWGPGQPSVRNFLGAKGRVDSVRVAGRDTIKVKFTYNSRGQVTAVTDPGGHVVQSTYDEWGDPSGKGTTGNLIEISYPGGKRSRRILDGFGRDSVIAASGRDTVRLYHDLLNRVVKQRGSSLLSDTTTFAYQGGLLVQVRDAKGQEFRTDFNRLGWPTRIYDPDSARGFIALRYDIDGLVTGQTNRRGQVLSVGYDALHRVTARRGARPAADSFAYNATGTISAGYAGNGAFVDSTFASAIGWTDSIVSHFGGQRFRRLYKANQDLMLDSVDIRSATLTLGPKKYFWNATTFQLDSLRYSSSVFTFAYNREGMLERLKYPNGTTTTLAFTSGHRLTRQYFSDSTVNDALQRLYGFDSLGRVSQVSRRTTLQSPGVWNREFKSYTYGPLGGVTREAIQTRTCGGDPDQHYGYLCDSLTAPFSERVIAYDDVGNIIQESNAGTVSYGQYTTGNRPTSAAGFNFEHDLDGNITRQYNGTVDRRFFWSPDGLLDSVKLGSYIKRFQYNAFRELVTITSSSGEANRLLWDRGHLAAVLDSAATSRVSEYLHGPGIDAPLAVRTGSTRYLAQDGMSNVIGVFSGANAVLQRLAYTPFGQGTSPTSSWGDTLRLRWKGLLYDGDSTGLYYARNRWYSPSAHRFVSEDPIGIAGGTNVYLFAGNDGINGRDPLGLFSEQECLANWPDGRSFGACQALPGVTIIGYHTPMRDWVRYASMGDVLTLASDWMAYIPEGDRRGDGDLASRAAKTRKREIAACVVSAAFFLGSAAADVTMLSSIRLGVGALAAGGRALNGAYRANTLNLAGAYGHLEAYDASRQVVSNAGRAGWKAYGAGLSSRGVEMWAERYVTEADWSSYLQLAPVIGSMILADKAIDACAPFLTQGPR